MHDTKRVARYHHACNLYETFGVSTLFPFTSRPPMSEHDAPVQEHAETNADDLNQVVRRRGIVAGWWIAWPFFLLTMASCVIAAVFQWQQRPQLVPFTIGLYMCMAFFAHAYAIAWQTSSHVRQMLSMIMVVVILICLIALHLDDGYARWVYQNGHRVLRPPHPALHVAVGLNIVAIVVIVSHGFGLGFGHRFFHRESGKRLSHSVVRQLLADARERFRES